MGIRDIVSTLAEVPALLALKRGLKPLPPDTRDSPAAQVERNAAQHGDCAALVCEGRAWTWSAFNAEANRYAHALAAAGLKRGDTVCLAMENRAEFLLLAIAANKLGVIPALINTGLRERSLAHCIRLAKARKCIFGSELAAAIGGVREDLDLRSGQDYYVVPDGAADALPDWALDLCAASADASTDNPPQSAGNTLADTAAYLFTSGTTGLPKAAVFSNRRFLAMAKLAGGVGLRCTPADRIYLCLPLYHGTGFVIGYGASLASGASVFLRRRFSARAFLPEVREHRCTRFLYVGEVCRYLGNTPRRPDDADNPLAVAMGNGLRPDVWMDFKQRFGIGRITEFYGASEGNTAFANLLNKDCTIGMTSGKVALVRYDVDADAIVRDAHGRCIEVADGEPGLLLGHINPNAVFEGYTDAAETEKKIVRNAFEQGDAWFNTGDLLRTVDVGFNLGFPHYQFVDRTGDTFRWKSENISTNEVGEILCGFPGVAMCNVYGVEIPGADGRAGMAALHLDAAGGELDLEAIARYADRELPPCARPVFLRVQRELAVTGTFKMVKGDLRREGFDSDAIADPVYVRLPGEAAYQRLDAALLRAVRAGEVAF